MTAELDSIREQIWQIKQEQREIKALLLKLMEMVERVTGRAMREFPQT